jgi:hypothetical protein
MVNANGSSAEANRYKFDQACRVKAIELAGALFPDAETKLSINFPGRPHREPAPRNPRSGSD